jgi:hypothetical protein
LCANGEIPKPTQLTFSIQGQKQLDCTWQQLREQYGSSLGKDHEQQHQLIEFAQNQENI